MVGEQAKLDAGDGLIVRGIEFGTSIVVPAAKCELMAAVPGGPFVTLALFAADGYVEHAHEGTSQALTYAGINLAQGVVGRFAPRLPFAARVTTEFGLPFGTTLFLTRDLNESIKQGFIGMSFAQFSMWRGHNSAKSNNIEPAEQQSFKNERPLRGDPVSEERRVREAQAIQSREITNSDPEKNDSGVVKSKADAVPTSPISDTDGQHQRATHKYKYSNTTELYSVDGDEWRIRTTRQEGTAIDTKFEGRVEILPTGEVKLTRGLGESQVRHLDGSWETISSSGRTNTVEAIYGFERATLEQSVQSLYRGSRFERFNKSLVALELRSSSLTENQKAVVYHHLNRLLADNQQAPLPRSIRMDLAEQILNHTGYPQSVDQGFNPTCCLAALENRLYVRDPQAVAQLIADVATNGRYITDYGAIVEMKNIPGGLRPDQEGRQNMTVQNNDPSIKIDGSRDFASQIVETVMANSYYARNRFPIAGDWLVELSSLRHASSTDRQLVLHRPDGASVRLFDVDGNPLQRRDWEIAYDQKHYPVVKWAKPGEIAYGRQQSEVPTDTGNRLYDLSTGSAVALKDSKGQIITTPKLCESELLNIESDLTGRDGDKPFYIAWGPKQTVASGVIRVNGAEMLDETLQKMAADGSLPALLKVNANHPPFTRTSTYSSIESDAAWHCIGIHGYDPATKMMNFTNQWGREWDYMGDRAVPLDTIFRSMQDGGNLK
jgi:hypothetical protein